MSLSPQSGKAAQIDEKAADRYNLPQAGPTEVFRVAPVPPIYRIAGG